MNDICKSTNQEKNFNNFDFNKVDKGTVAIDKWCSSSKDFEAYKRYTQNSFFEQINGALRSGLTDDYFVLNDIECLDRIFKTMPDEATPKEDMVVYRGTYLSKDLKDIIDGKSSTDIFVEKGFASTSKSKNVAKSFAYAENPDKILLKITIPKGSKVIDDEELPSYARSKMQAEQEVLIPRNAQFKILSYNPRTKTADAIYLGQKYPLKMPEVIKVSGADILSNINKIMVNKEFDFKKLNL